MQVQHVVSSHCSYGHSCVRDTYQGVCTEEQTVSGADGQSSVRDTYQAVRTEEHSQWTHIVQLCQAKKHFTSDPQSNSSKNENKPALVGLNLKAVSALDSCVNDRVTYSVFFIFFKILRIGVFQYSPRKDSQQFQGNRRT